MCACVNANVIPQAPSTHTVSRLGLELPRIHLSRLPRTGIARTPYHAQFFAGVLGIKLRSSCLPGKHFTNGDISAALFCIGFGLGFRQGSCPRPASNLENDLELPPLEC